MNPTIRCFTAATHDELNDYGITDATHATKACLAGLMAINHVLAIFQFLTGTYSLSSILTSLFANQMSGFFTFLG